MKPIPVLRTDAWSYVQYAADRLRGECDATDVDEATDALGRARDILKDLLYALERAETDAEQAISN